MERISHVGKRLLRGGYLLLRRYTGHNVSTQSAALAFYLLFTMFPLLIFFSSLLGLLQLEQTELLGELTRFLPEEVLELVRSYLAYAGRNFSMRLLLFGLFFSLYFPARAASRLMRAVRTAYRLGTPGSPVGYLFRTLVYTGLLMVTVAVTVALMTAGGRLLDWAVRTAGLPRGAALLWRGLRFPVMAVVMYFALFVLYAMAQDQRRPAGEVWPGVVAALLGWMVISALYAYYVENIASYSLLYGSLGAVVVLMMWLYLTAGALILGAEFNGMLVDLRRERAGVCKQTAEKDSAETKKRQKAAGKEQ